MPSLNFDTNELIDELISNGLKDALYNEGLVSDSQLDELVRPLERRMAEMPSMDDVVRCGDLSYVWDELRAQLRDMPSQYGDRCGLGQAFTHAVNTIIGDYLEEHADDLHSMVRSVIQAEPEPIPYRLSEAAARDGLVPSSGEPTPSAAYTWEHHGPGNGTETLPTRVLQAPRDYSYESVLHGLKLQCNANRLYTVTGYPDTEVIVIRFHESSNGQEFTVDQAFGVVQALAYAFGIIPA